MAHRKNGCGCKTPPRGPRTAKVKSFSRRKPRKCQFSPLAPRRGHPGSLESWWPLLSTIMRLLSLGSSAELFLRPVRRVQHSL